MFRVGIHDYHKMQPLRILGKAYRPREKMLGAYSGNHMWPTVDFPPYVSNHVYGGGSDNLASVTTYFVSQFFEEL